MPTSVKYPLSVPDAALREHLQRLGLDEPLRGIFRRDHDAVSDADLAWRIVTFDNDGTLWAEQPMYFQLLFALHRVKVLAPQHPEWAAEEPFASLLKGDVRARSPAANGEGFESTRAHSHALQDGHNNRPRGWY
ncbi:hypothetical protein [Bradyrhizobium sp. 41S5]|uniref:hypothetical protein n=1 Tax=Bradyrhizobium sp. 41S5 TaxID=1404443 RepID=UPI0035303144